MKTTRYALLAIADEETLGCRVWEGPWIPESAFAGYGTGNMTPALVRYKNESINRLVTKFIKAYTKNPSQSFISIWLLVPFPLHFLDRKTCDPKIICDTPNHKRHESTIGDQRDN